MFTGIVEDLGEVEAIDQAGDSARIAIRSAKVSEDARPGDSIAVNGVCLTVTGLIGGRLGADNTSAAPGAAAVAPPRPRGFTADVMGETLKRSSLGGIAPGTKVNLERSVRLEDRLGGHLVQGHVDDTAASSAANRKSTGKSSASASRPAWPGTSSHKGSIAVDGISLTVSRRSATTGSR